jgi:putative iron-dependent peroxidase
MAISQAGIFNSDASTHHHYLEFTVKDGVEAAVLKKQLGLVRKLEHGQLVMAFGPNCWQAMQPNTPMNDLTNFESIEGLKGHRCTSTQQDLLFWLHCPTERGHSYNFDNALNIIASLEGIADLTLEIQGVKYHDSRDLTGFIDGTANPKDEHQYLESLIPDGAVGEKGSYVLTQKWVHNLNAFNTLPQHKQEQVIGRTKPDSIELEGDAMPNNSHVSRTDATLDGKAAKVYRRSTPFGNSQEKGLYFVSFANQQARHQIQLDRMFGVTGDGIYDRLLDFSNAKTSSYWFAPSQTALDALLVD